MPTFTGSAENSQKFKKKNSEEIGLNYHHDMKARMRSNVFCVVASLSFIYTAMPKRNLILFIDNCSPHRNESNIFDWSNVSI